MIGTATEPPKAGVRSDAVASRAVSTAAAITTMAAAGQMSALTRRTRKNMS